MTNNDFMSDTPIDKSKPEANTDRIEELESQVRELSSLVSVMMARAASEEEDLLLAPQSEHAGEDIGSDLHSAGDWVGWGIAGLFLTAIGFVGGWILHDQRLLLMQRLGLGYGLSTLAFAGSFFLRRGHVVMRRGLLSVGFSALVLTTYAGFGSADAGLDIVDPARWFVLLVVAGLALVLPLRLHDAVVALVAVTALGCASVLGLILETSNERALIGMITVVGVSASALAARMLYTWRWFYWSAWVEALFVTIFIGIFSNEFLDTLPVWSLVITGGCIWIVMVVATTWAERQHDLRNVGAVFIFVGGIMTLVAERLWDLSIEGVEPWWLRIGIGVLCLVWTVFALSFTGRNGRLWPPVLCVGILWMLSGAISIDVNVAWLWLILGAGGLLATLAYAWTQNIFFSGVGMIAALASTLFVFEVSQAVGEIQILNAIVPAMWIWTPIILGMLILSAFIYEWLGEFVSDHESSFLPEAFHLHTIPALFHAAAAAMLVLIVTLLQFRGEPSLPFLLAGEGLTMSVIGLIVIAPAVEAGGFLLLAAGHAAFFVLYFTQPQTLNEDPAFPIYLGGLAGATLLGSAFWERYLRYVGAPGSIGFGVLAAIPGVAAVVLWAFWSYQMEHILPVSLWMGLTAATLMGVSWLSGLISIRFGAVTAMILTGERYLRDLYRSDALSAELQTFIYELVAILLVAVLAERFLYYSKAKRMAWDIVRWAIVGAGSVIGVLALYEKMEPSRVTLSWFALTIVWLALGTILQESRYRVAALLIYLGPIGIHVFVHDLADWEPIPRFAAVAGILAPGAAISWVFVEHRARRLGISERQRPKALPAPEEPANVHAETQGEDGG